MKNKIGIILLIAFSVYFVSCNSQRYTNWQYDVKLNNLSCEKVRYYTTNDGKDTIAIECVLKNNTVIDGFPCSTERLSLTKDWRLKSFVISDDFVLNGNVIPEGTYIRVYDDRLLCMFPDDTEYQGYFCGGSYRRIGTEGIHTSLYPNGKLQSFFPVNDVMIGNVLCKSSPFAGVRLYENGTLKRCKLAKDQSIAGVEYKRNARLNFDKNGNVIND